jgi:DNA polymerase-3 subunit beta
MGVNLQQENSEVVVCGTDGHRLLRVSNVPVKSARTKSLIIPSKAVKFVDKFMGDEVGVGLRGHNHIQFDLEDGVVLYTRLIQERYPDYDSVFPAYSTSEFKVNRLELLRILKVGNVCANVTTHQLQLAIKAKSSLIELCCDDIVTERNWNAKIEIEDRKGGEDDFEVGYNLKYLMPILKIMGSKEVTFHFTNPVSATLITNDDPRETFLLMPIRLNDAC